MKTEKEILDFLATLQWKRFNKLGLELELSNFFGVNMKLSDSTCDEFMDVDYSFITTTQQGENDNFADIEIYYLKMRQRGHFIITETSLIDYNNDK